MPADQPELDSTKGDRRFQIVDTTTNQIIEQIDMGQKLAEAGYHLVGVGQVGGDPAPVLIFEGVQTVLLERVLERKGNLRLSRSRLGEADEDVSIHFPHRRSPGSVLSLHHTSVDAATVRSDEEGAAR